MQCSANASWRCGRVPRPQAPTVETLRSFAANDLAQYKLPDAVVIVEDLPRTASGKVEKFRLRSQL